MIKKLALDDSPKTGFFRAVQTLLQNNPDLARVVKRWAFWVGEEEDVRAADLTDLPYVKVSPMSDQAEITAVDVSQSPMLLQVETYINGTNADDLLNLHWALQRALFPGDGTVSTLLGKYGFHQLVLVNEGYKALPLAGSYCLAGLLVVQAKGLTPTRT